MKTQTENKYNFTATQTYWSNRNIAELD